jgi:ERCC4-type nuclease
VFNVICDTREKTPFIFAHADINQVISKKLDTGDYSIEGLEDILCIERKRSVAEIANNLTDNRFDRELERMMKYKYRFILCEFNYYNIDIYPRGSEIPKAKWDSIRIKAPFIRSKLVDIMIRYGVQIIFCENAEYASEIATTIMRKIYNLEYRR